MPEMSFTLNSKEKSVLGAFPAPAGDEKTGEFVTLEYLAKKAFGDQKRGSAPTSKGNSWVRNSLRKLLSLDLVKHGPNRSGKYARTKVDLAELEEKEKKRLEAAKKQGDAAKTRTKAGRAAKKGKEGKGKSRTSPSPASSLSPAASEQARA